LTSKFPGKPRLWSPNFSRFLEPPPPTFLPFFYFLRYQKFYLW